MRWKPEARKSWEEVEEGTMVMRRGFRGKKGRVLGYKAKTCRGGGQKEKWTISDPFAEHEGWGYQGGHCSDAADCWWNWLMTGPYSFILSFLLSSFLLLLSFVLSLRSR